MNNPQILQENRRDHKNNDNSPINSVMNYKKKVAKNPKMSQKYPKL